MRADAAQHRAVADPGRAKDNVLPVRQIVREKDAVQIGLVPGRNERLAFLVVARPHHALHVAAETLDSSGREHGFRRAADAHIKINPAVGNRGRHGCGDVAISDHPQ